MKPCPALRHTATDAARGRGQLPFGLRKTSAEGTRGIFALDAVLVRDAAEEGREGVREAGGGTQTTERSSAADAGRARVGWLPDPLRVGALLWSGTKTGAAGGGGDSAEGPAAGPLSVATPGVAFG